MKDDFLIMAKNTQKALIASYYKKHPNKEILHKEVVDWATDEWKKLTGEVFRDPDRAIRSLYQEGLLVKIDQGIYKYDPLHVEAKDQENFSQAQREKIFKRDGYKCVICGKGKGEGIILHADHIKPKERGGKATIENGQTLCSQHNMFKKNLNQTETGKRMIIRLYDFAKSQRDKKLQEFCKDILKVYEKHNMNGHIRWRE